MRVFLSILTIATLSVSTAQAFTLVCKVTPVAEGNAGDIYYPTPQSILEDWMAPKQIFIIDLKQQTAIHKRYNVKADFDFIDDKVIRWSFKGTRSEKGKIKNSDINFKYSYIRKSKKLVATIDFGGLSANIRGSRPKCVEQ